MNWEQKLEALQVIADSSLRMRKPGDWYVDAYRREIGGDGMLVHSYGNGNTPQEAVEDDWRKMVEQLPANKYIQAADRKRYRWAGFMWKEVR